MLSYWFPLTSESAAAQVDELIISYLQGSLDAANTARLMAWRNSNKANEERFNSIERVWTLTAALGEPGIENRPSVTLVDAIPSGLGDEEVSRTNLRRLWSGRRSHAFAAAAVLLMITTTALSVGRLRISTVSEFASTTIQTGEAELTTVSLSDGSTVRLGPSSTVELTQEDGAVIANLTGRAFFGITPGRETPFIVRTPYGDANVLGTRFEVRTEREQLQVLVVEGKVQLTTATSRTGILLGPRELGSVNADGHASLARMSDVHERLAWMGRTLVFNDTPLSEVVAELEERYSAQIELRDQRFETVLVTATFVDQSLASTIEVICELLSLECTYEGEAVIIGAVSALQAPVGSYRVSALP